MDGVPAGAAAWRAVVTGSDAEGWSYPHPNIPRPEEALPPSETRSCPNASLYGHSMPWAGWQRAGGPGSMLASVICPQPRSSRYERRCTPPHPVAFGTLHV